MATFAVGDIHGHLPALSEVLDQIRRAARPADTVVFLGDYIDRGPDSKGCVDAILKFRHETPAEVVGLLGNHEDWFLRTWRDYARHSWVIGMEAFETVKSYSPEAVDVLREAMAQAGAALYLGQCRLPYEVFFDAVPVEHVQFFAGLRLYHQTVDGLFSHGGVDPRISDVHEQSAEALLWGAGGFPSGYRDANVVVYGHHDNATLDSQGWPGPTTIGRTIGIDTISHGVLTAIRLPDQRWFQSSRYETATPDVQQPVPDL